MTGCAAADEPVYATIHAARCSVDADANNDAAWNDGWYADDAEYDANAFR